MTKNLDNVLAYVDYSEESLNAVNSAIEMCKRHNCKLHLVEVMDNGNFFPTAGMQAPLVSVSHEMIQGAIVKLEMYASSIRQEHGIDCVSHHVTGGVVSSVCARAEELNCDILVLGTDPNGDDRSFLVDDLAYKILKSAPCPVLTVPRQSRASAFKKILFPIRPVLNALEKFQFANSLIKKNKASVHLVGALSSENADQFNTVKRLLASAEQQLDQDNVATTHELHFGRNIAESILKAGRKMSIDLIVITASTKRSFKQFFYGNYAQRIINNVDTAVLCIKPSKYSSEYHEIPSFKNSTLG